jgi:hypothetical protein
MSERIEEVVVILEESEKDQKLILLKLTVISSVRVKSAS